MAHRLFEGKEHAASYRKYRISPSDHLIEQVLDFLEKQVSVGRIIDGSVILSISKLKWSSGSDFQ